MAMNITFFASAGEWRSWLHQHGGQARELWVGFYKKQSGKGGITYPAALDEALCFGWIDGVRRGVDASSYTIRFAPRKAKSIWSLVNRKRRAELLKQKRVTATGLTAFENRDHKTSGTYSYEQRPRKLGAAYEKQLRARRKAWAFFRDQAPSYQRVASFWVMNARKEETRLRRLATLIRDSENRRRLGVVTLKKREKGS
jgi:uncharacterized protein YdeI (YjbR/CyaY-like superfamily)